MLHLGRFQLTFLLHITHGGPAAYLNPMQRPGEGRGAWGCHSGAQRVDEGIWLSYALQQGTEIFTVCLSSSKSFITRGVFHHDSKKPKANNLLMQTNRVPERPRGNGSPQPISSVLSPVRTSHNPFWLVCLIAWNLDWLIPWELNTNQYLI